MNEHVESEFNATHLTTAIAGTQNKTDKQIAILRTFISRPYVIFHLHAFYHIANIYSRIKTWWM